VRKRPQGERDLEREGDSGEQEREGGSEKESYRKRVSFLHHYRIWNVVGSHLFLHSLSILFAPKS